jgi:diguanylate cyclase (GGDEF)-like protein
MASLFGGEGSRSAVRRGGEQPSRRRQPFSKLVLTVCYTLVVILAGALALTDGLVSTADLGLGAGVLAGPLAMAGVSNRRRKPAEPLPMIDLGELSARIGTTIVEIEPDGVAHSGDDPARAGRSALASLYDLHLFAVLGLPRFQAARDNGSRCSIVVLSVDSWSRYDAPVAKDAALPLEGVAKAIRQNIRTADIAARYGDDEFVIFLDRCDRLEAQRIVQRLSQSVFDLQTAAGRLSLSAGIAVFPDCGVDMHSLIQRADSVLRDIRATGRSEVRLVVPEWTHSIAMQSSPA